ncbi:MAG TPA: DMT family transporter [Pseudonocardia sp.]|jgi:DME family drug/metabolite transporter
MSSLSQPGASTAPGNRVDQLFVVAAGLLWGTGGLTGVLLSRVAHLPPLAVATYRLAGGGLLLVIWLGCLGRLPRPGRAVLARAVLVRAGALGLLTAVYQSCYFAAVALAGIPVATLVTLGAAPVLVLAAEVCWQRSRPGPATLGAIGVAVLGLLLLVGGPGSTTGGGSPTVGVLLALTSAAGFAVMTLLGRRPVAGLAGPAAIGLGFLVGAVLLAGISPLAGGLAFPPGLVSVGLLGYFCLVPTALAYSLYFTGLRGVTASSAAVVAVLEPVTATVLGVLVLGSTLSVRAGLGAVLLCVAAVAASTARA